MPGLRAGTIKTYDDAAGGSASGDGAARWVAEFVQIITRTIPGQRKLQYEGRDVCALLEPLHQILADTASVEGFE